MTYNHLNFISFLLYVELLFALLIVIHSFLVPIPLTIVTSIFNIISYKTDAIVLYLNIPFTIIEIVSLKILIGNNTGNCSWLLKLAFIIGGMFILIINQLLHRKSVYELAIKENNYLLKYSAWRFFKLVKWLYPLVFVLSIVFNFDFSNPISNGLFFLMDKIYQIKYVGAFLPVFGGLLLVGSIWYAIIFLFTFRKLKRTFEADFYHDGGGE
jgi:hypothetical protein